MYSESRSLFFGCIGLRSISDRSSLEALVDIEQTLLLLFKSRHATFVNSYNHVQPLTPN